jgi:hypothetical protein
MTQMAGKCRSSAEVIGPNEMLHLTSGPRLRSNLNRSPAPPAGELGRCEESGGVATGLPRKGSRSLTIGDTAYR